MRHQLPHSRLLVAFFLSAVLPLEAWAQVGCPFTELELDWRRILTLDAARDTAFSAPGRSGSTSFDLKEGTLAAMAGAEGSTHALTRVTDEFMVTGPQMGTRIDVVVELTASLRAYKARAGQGSSTATVSLTAPWGQRLDRTIEGSVENHVLTLPLTMIVGVPAKLTAEVRADAGQGMASAQASYRFVGLPAGAKIASCHGYAGDGAVPSHPVYWGEVKSRYRR
jgi:hypothetical protein